MEKLFKDSETFQKDRPTKATDAQIEKMYSNLSDEIIERGWNNDYGKESIIADLKELSFSDAAFEKAKTMDDFGGYDMDIDFIEWLDDLYWEKRKLIDYNIEQWVKAHNILPKHKKGTKLIVKKDLCRTLISQSEVYVTGFNHKRGCYLIDGDPHRGGGTVLSYEKVHECSEVI